MSEVGQIAALLANGGRPWDEATIEAFSEHVWHPEIRWRAIEGAPDDVGPMEGRERLRRYYAEWFELFEDIRQEVCDQRDVGDQLVLAMRVTARARSTGMPLELDYGLVCELRDGLIVSGREYASFDAALTAAEARATRLG
jgi:ketosteroid isomerase-like protein